MTRRKRRNDKSLIIIILLVVLLPLFYVMAVNFPEGSLFGGKKPNKLIDEKSPYLQQHAYNPVDWYPWGDEALNKAKDENKPIFLSVGYSTCYWCHVMEEEVFENDSIAKIMNENFVNIKVDREERPDIDRIYMTALNAMTGSGGWPMSMFLTPDLEPFFGGTYIPAYTSDQGQGFVDLITQISTTWKNNPAQITSAGSKFATIMEEYSKREREKSALKNEIFDLGFSQYVETFDKEYGGFSEAPKFPRTIINDFLFQHSDKTGDEQGKEMSIKTLNEISNGGIYDHLGGGFHRYSVDRYWRVPHFEKMLYDQALISSTLTDAYLISNNNLYKTRAEETLNYVLRKLTSENGGFYSAEDAIGTVEGGEKKEGAYYLWSNDEINKLLGDKAEIFKFYYGVKNEGNVPASSDPKGEMKGMNVLYIAQTIDETAKKFKKSNEDIIKILNESKKKLFAEREKRPVLHMDDKVLVSWNGLMISAFSKGYSAFGNQRYLEAAKKSAEFIINNLYDEKSGTLKRRYREEESKFEGNLVDYAFLIQGLLDLYEASYEQKYLETANKLAGSMIRIFYDEEKGGFFDISGNDKSLIIKTKDDFDGVEPTGNSIAILDLLRLAQYTDNKDYHTKAKNSLEFFSGDMSKHPSGMPQMLSTLYFYLYKPKQIIITGDVNNPETKALIAEVNKRYIPGKIHIIASKINDSALIPYLDGIIVDKNVPMAYVCENYSCKLPTNNPVQLSKLLNE